MNLNTSSRNFVGALRTTTTNCRVSFIDLQSVVPTNFRIVFLSHIYKHCNFTGTVLWSRSATSAHRLSAFLDYILRVCQNLLVSFIQLGKFIGFYNWCFVLWRKCCMCSCSLFFTAAYFHRVGHYYFSFSHCRYKVIMFFFQRNWCPLFFISRSRSFSVIHVNLERL